MTSEVIPGTYENGIVKLSKKPKITGKRDVLIVFKEETDTSVIQAAMEVLS